MYHVSVCFVNTLAYIKVFLITSEKLQHMTTSPFIVASLSHNFDFNRFRNIYPCKKTRFYTWLKFHLFLCTKYDNSRVELTEVLDLPGSDYINASFISVSAL